MTPKAGWYWAQCCILDLHRVDTEDEVREILEHEEDCPGDWWPTLDEAIANYRAAMQPWSPDYEAAAQQLLAERAGNLNGDERG